MKIFIGGSKMISDIDKNVKEKLDEIIKNKYEVLIGDCWGIDAAVQKFFVEKDYRIHWNFTVHTLPYMLMSLTQIYLLTTLLN